MSPAFDVVKHALRDRYAIERVIGHGSMGTVYLATSVTNPETGPVAVKTFESVSDEVRARFLQELNAVARLSHPNILSIIGSGEIPGFLYLVMPFIDGKSVDRILDGNQTFSVRNALTICECVANALTLAHRHGVIHRDIKPSNVIVPSESGELRYDKTLLSDFGAVGLIAPDTHATQIGQVFGTPLYMSPEQIQARAQTTATDVYGVGALLYRMIFGHPPFRGANIVDLMVRINTEPVSFPREPALPPPVLAFLKKCLAKNPGDRPKRIDLELRRLRDLVSPSTAVGRTPEITANEDALILSRTVQPVSTPARAAAAESAPSRATERAPVRMPRPYSLATGAVLLVTAIICLVATQLELGPRAPGIIVGVALIVGGIAVGLLVFRWIKTVKSDLRTDASRLLNIASDHTDLSASLTIEVNQLLARCRGLDEQFLGKSIALMIREYHGATSPDDRINALATAVGFVEKLSTRMSPWYVRNDKLIAFVVSAVGIASGVVAMIDTLLKMD